MSDPTPPGVAHAPFIITDTDKRGVIVVVSIVLLSFLLVSFLTRIWVRLRVSGPWSYDDTTLTIATVRSSPSADARGTKRSQIFGIGQSIAVFVEVHEGFGLSKDALSEQSIASVGAVCLAIPHVNP